MASTTTVTAATAAGHRRRRGRKGDCERGYAYRFEFRHDCLS
jgi:hypothetical protein